MRNSILIFLILMICASCGVKKELWDNHCHVFSKELYGHLKFNARGSEHLTGSHEKYSNIDSILLNNSADKVVLISTGYAYSYRPHRYLPEQIEALLKLENNYLSDIIQTDKNKLLGFYGVNPLEPFALSEIKRCHTTLNFHGIKMHFHSSKVDLLDEETVSKLKPIFAYIQEHSIPVIIHFKNHKWDFNKKDIAVFFNKIIDLSKPTTLIFAHMGGDGLITEKTIETVTEILSYSENSKLKLYFDLSAIVYKDFFEDIEVSDIEKKNLLNKVGFDRLLFGSDYPARTYGEYVILLTDRLKLSKKELKQILTNNIY